MDYMGIFVERDVEPAVNSGASVKCNECRYGPAVDRAECNACARAWQADGSAPGFDYKPVTSVGALAPYSTMAQPRT